MISRRNFLQQSAAVTTLPMLPIEALSELPQLRADLAKMPPSHRISHALRALEEIHIELKPYASEKEKCFKFTTKQDLESEQARLSLAKEFVGSINTTQIHSKYAQQAINVFNNISLSQKLKEADLLLKSVTTEDRQEFMRSETWLEFESGSSFNAGFYVSSYSSNLIAQHGLVKATEIAFASVEKQKEAYSGATDRIKNGFLELAEKLSDRSTGISPLLASWLRLAGHGEFQRLVDSPCYKAFSGVFLDLPPFDSSLNSYSIHLRSSPQEISHAARELNDPYGRELNLDGTHLIAANIAPDTADVLADPLLKKLHSRTNPYVGLVADISTKLSKIEQHTQELVRLGVLRSDLVLLETPTEQQQQVSVFLKSVRAVQNFIASSQPGNTLPKYLANNLSKQLSTTEALATKPKTGEWEANILLRIEMIRAHRYLASGIF